MFLRKNSHLKICDTPKRDYHFVLFFALAAVSIYAVFNSYYYFLLFIPAFIYLLQSKIKLVYWIFISLTVSVVIVFYLLFKNYLIIEHFSQWIDCVLHFSIRQHTIIWINNHYNITTASFIELIMFNIKNSQSIAIYRGMVDLSIVYLIIVSGFHLAIIKRIINIIFKKRYAIANLVSTTIIFVYLYFLNFAVSAFRVFSTLILSIFLRRRCNSPYEILGLSGLISLLLGPSIAFNAGFCLSYLCTAGIIFIGTLNINNIFLEKVLINLIAIVISLPFVLTMNRYISFWVLFNSFIFAYFFCFIFLALLFTFWIVWFLPLQDYITSGAWWLIKIALVNNIKIYINPFAPWVEVIYYQAIFLTIILINYHYHDD